jgi:hypothetical protein
VSSAALGITPASLEGVALTITRTFMRLSF